MSDIDTILKVLEGQTFDSPEEAVAAIEAALERTVHPQEIKKARMVQALKRRGPGRREVLSRTYTDKELLELIFTRREFWPSVEITHYEPTDTGVRGRKGNRSKSDPTLRAARGARESLLRTWGKLPEYPSENMLERKRYQFAVLDAMEETTYWRKDGSILSRDANTWMRPVGDEFLVNVSPRWTGEMEPIQRRIPAWVVWNHIKQKLLEGPR